jgi:hypothetical protein
MSNGDLDFTSPDSPEFCSNHQKRNPELLPHLSAATEEDADFVAHSLCSKRLAATLLATKDSSWMLDEQRLSQHRADTESHSKHRTLETRLTATLSEKVYRQC